MPAEVESCVTCRFSEIQFGYKMPKSPQEKRYWLYFNCYRFPGHKAVSGDGCGEHESTNNPEQKTADYETYKDILRMHEEIEGVSCPATHDFPNKERAE